MRKKTIPSQDQLREKREASYQKRLVRLTADPTCSMCGKTKTVADFPVRDVAYWCNACRASYTLRLWRNKRSGLSDEALRKLRNRENERHRASRKKQIAAMTHESLLVLRQKQRKESRARHADVREKVFSAYGGWKCACCGITEPMFLSIDHVNNDGAEHKRNFVLRTSTQVYRWLVKNNFPSGFQVLCMNCQWGKRNNRGICPHQIKGVTTIPKGSRAKRPEAQRVPVWG